MRIDIKQIMDMQQLYRVNFINSLIGYKPAVLLGTRNGNGNTNLAIFSSIFHLGANPPLFGLIFRPQSVERHTLDNILSTRIFTVNLVNDHIIEPSHQTSARYPADVTEFAETGLTEEYLPGVYPPFVAESNIKFCATFAQKIDLNINGTTLVIARIKQVIVPDAVLLPDGYIDQEQAGTVATAGLDAYHVARQIVRLTHAKTDTWPTELNQTVAK